MQKNNEKLKSALLAFGLSQKQGDLYLACLENGALTVQDAARLSRINRTTLYSQIEEMEEMGVINLVKKSGKTFIESVSPERLLHILSERQELFASVLPDLQTLKLKPRNGPQVRFYRGKEGFKFFFRSLLDSGVSEWLIITSGKEFLSFVSERYIAERIIKEKRRRKIKSRQIISDSQYAREIVRKDKLENRESRIVDSGARLPVVEIIFGNSVAIISSNFTDLIMVIESQEVAETHRSYFELIWKNARV
jgi:sugar-specific transcriptional regulator TrmB